MSVSMWPLARHNVPLADHLARTAVFARRLFERDVEVLAKRLEWSSNDLLEVLTVSAAIHDIGKSSEFYKKRAKSDNEQGISFPYHEFASATVVLMILNEGLPRGLDERRERELRLVARVIARHHAAIECRHPSDIRDDIRDKKCSKALGVIKDATQGLKLGVLLETLESVKSKLREVMGGSESSLQLLGELMGGIASYESSLSSMINKLNERTVEHIVGDLKLSSLGDEREKLAVMTLSGMLIVSDILAASLCESARSEHPPSYALHWLNELRDRIEASRDEIKLVCREADWGVLVSV